ncbi:23S rRNA (uridine(2552)-2'-O)-methyltransferase [Methanothermococcus sp. SCGC AD-155-M21]|nr:23S rRNA (uridine(2552)-2'-O)-methyltransferase [Methanothermococcus sp. SCGC AD-155-M21]
MGKKDKRWVLQRKKDTYYKLAKKNKYRSRAVYKLFQLNERFNIIKEGNVVVDLGCAPGGWLQATRSIVGEEGFVVGVDLQSVKPLNYENIVVIKGDMTKKEILDRIIKEMPSKANAVICDASPNISGVWDVDHTRSIELCTMALISSTKLLKKDGNFVVKVFQGYLFDNYISLLKNYFRRVYTTKPKASRNSSAEAYVIGKGFFGHSFNRNIKSPILRLIENNVKNLTNLDDEEYKCLDHTNENKKEDTLLIKRIKSLRKKKE